MSNKVAECQGCIYNVPKTKGGQGRLCNGLTMKLYRRCPEWRISELIREGKKSNLIEIVE